MYYRSLKVNQYTGAKIKFKKIYIYTSSINRGINRNFHFRQPCQVTKLRTSDKTSDTCACTYSSTAKNSGFFSFQIKCRMLQERGYHKNGWAVLLWDIHFIMNINRHDLVIHTGVGRYFWPGRQSYCYSHTEACGLQCRNRLTDESGVYGVGVGILLILL